MSSYALTFFLLGCGSEWVQRMLGGPVMERPVKPILASVIGGLTAVAWAGWFIRGFWIAWWLPLVMLPLGGVGTAFVLAWGRGSGRAPLWAMLICLAGLVSLAMSIFVS